MVQHYRAVFTDMTNTNVLCQFGIVPQIMSSVVGNGYVSNVCGRLINKPNNLVWGGECNNFFATAQKAKQANEIEDYGELLKANHIYVNHTKREWFDINKSGDIHPLPLLTTDVNVNDIGYDGVFMELVGIWCGNLIEVTQDEVYVVKKGYREIYPFFTTNPITALKNYKIKRNYITYDIINVQASNEIEALKKANEQQCDIQQICSNLQIYQTSNIESN